MENDARIILIGNYQPDKQESMQRFARMLEGGFQQAGYKTEIWYPTVFLGAASGNKWLGYVDKWILYPLVIRWLLFSKQLKSNQIRFHICDHSNAPYLKYLPADRTSITCHDVLAIRGALGYDDAHCSASGTGKMLQMWILRHLKRAERLASVSQLTLTQLRELAQNQEAEKSSWRVIHNAYNADFKPMAVEPIKALLHPYGLAANTPFLLHVGSGLPRKNRRLLLDMVVSMGKQWAGYICYAGKAVDESLMAHADSLGLRDRIISVINPDHETLVALYSACDAFLFPSFSEGFGWPVIEAQACGAPVIASGLAPMPEVSGGAAMYADPFVPQTFADAFLKLKDKRIRTDLIQRGFENARRFELKQIVSDYLNLYGLE